MLLRQFGGLVTDLKLMKRNKKVPGNILKRSITKKIFLLYVFLLVSTVIITSISSYLFFQKLLDSQLSNFDINTNTIRMKLEKLYEKKISVVELPNIDNTGDSNLLLEPLKKDYPEYNFKIETIEGIFEYQEKPRLIYDDKEGKYYFEITRQIKVKENLPFKSIKLSLKLNYYQIILKSLLFGAFFTFVFWFPVILIFSRRIIKPIISLSKGAKEIAAGNLGIKVGSNSKDEIGELANSFNYMSKELYKIKRIRDDLLAVVSHELRSPLGRIKGYTEILNDLKLKDKDKAMYFNSILNEIDFLNYMIGEIIEVSRLELNKERLFLERVDLVELIENVRDNLNLSKPIKKEVTYVFSYDRGLNCEIDIEKIRRVFLNVFENSIKAGSTEIKFNAKKENKKIKITIIDNGRGIPEDQLELVFEKFYRVDKSRDRETGGFGLGLAICKGIIKEHKGDIYFKKRDNGAELHIELPLIIN